MDLEQAAAQQDNDSALEVTVYASSPQETLASQEAALRRKKEELEKAIMAYNRRDRRYGGVKQA